MSWSSQIVARGYSLEFIDDNKFIFSKRNSIYQSKTIDGKKELIGVIPCSSLKKLMSHLRLAQRVLRLMVYNLIPLENGETFITFNKEIGILKNNVYSSLRGLVRPCRVLRGSCAISDSGDLYWGEYISNNERGPIHIYCYTPGNLNVEIVHTFAEEEIRHVHGIYKDPYSKRLWCVTGDYPHECKIMYTEDNFKSLKVFGEGDETWRTVSLLFTEDAIFYASDAEFRPNYIYRVDRKSKERKQIQIIDGPVYYSYKMNDELFFAVTAELCPSQNGTNASIWHVSPSQNVAKKILSHSKDTVASPFFVKLFMPGTFHFPITQSKKLREMYISCVGLKKVDNKILQITRNN